MLRELSIDNVVLIERERVGFSAGLNVVTGETGAGKSVLFAALGLALGERASTELVRTGAKSATVEARFSIEPGSPAHALLRAEGLGDGPEVLIQRTVPARGSGRSLVNGESVALPLLRRLGRLLVDYAGQHEQHTLLDPEAQLSLLDEFAGLEQELSGMDTAWTALSTCRDELERLRGAARHIGERAELLRFQSGELSELRPRRGEEAELLAERNLLRHAGELQTGVQRAFGLLYADDGAAVERLDGAAEALRRLAEIDPTLGEPARQLAELLGQVEDVARGLRGHKVEHDPERLDQVESRLAALDRLKRKHRCEADDLAARLERVQAELDELEHLDDRIVAAERALERSRDHALSVARDLHQQRARAAEALSNRVVEQLRELAMPHAGFEVRLIELDAPGPRGLDRVELMLSANVGEELRPMAKVASGGELSRVQLALRIAMRGRRGVDCFVFDEVDAGLGGVAADEVGRKLCLLAEGAQVLCITHLPQIARLADHHLAVNKEVRGGRTLSAIHSVYGEQRVLELARMIGGSPDAASVGYARSLLGPWVKVA